MFANLNIYTWNLAAYDGVVTNTSQIYRYSGLCWKSRRLFGLNQYFSDRNEMESRNEMEKTGCTRANTRLVTTKLVHSSFISPCKTLHTFRKCRVFC